MTSAASAVIPMESNPETMSKFLHKLGVSPDWRMVDVLSLEGETLASTPRPVLAVILLFPLSDSYEQHRQAEEIQITQGSHTQQTPDGLFHMKQVLSNVCGTIALVHSVANNTPYIGLADGLLKSYIDSAKNLDPVAKGELLQNTEAIFEAYKEIVHAGESGGPQEDGSVNNHFVTFIHKDGKLFELDGRKVSPIEHGPTTADTLLEDAAKVCKSFIARDPENIGFNVVALVSAE